MKPFFALLWLLIFLIPCNAQQHEAAAASFDELAARYRQVLERQPRKGYAFDLLYHHYLDAGKLDALAEEYEAAAKRSPGDAGLPLILGMLYDRRGQSGMAFAAYRRSAALAPDQFHASYYIAQLLAHQLKTDEAVAALRSAIAASPAREDLLEAHKLLGRLLVRSHRFEEAADAWDRLAQTFPDDSLVLEELGQLWAESGEYDRAIERYRQIIRLSADNLQKKVSSHIEIGELQLRQGNSEAALATFNQCLQMLDPESWLAENVRDRVEEVYLKADDVAGLETYYENRLRKDPGDIRTAMRLARSASRRGDRDAAIAHYKKTLQVAPRHKELRQALVEELVRAEAIGEAIAQVQQLLEQDPADAENLERLGQLYLMHSDLDRAESIAKALEAWQQIAKIRPDDPLAALKAAELCRKAAGVGPATALATPTKPPSDPKLLEQAELHYRMAGERAPQEAQYAEYLGDFLHALGRKEEGNRQWNRLQQAPFGTVEDYMRLTELFSKTNQSDKALATIREAADRFPERYDLHAAAARLLQATKEYDVALTHIDRMLALADDPHLEQTALEMKVLVLSSSGQLGNTFAELANRLRTQKGSARDYWLAALLAETQGNVKQAMEFATAALSQSPEDSRLMALSGRLQMMAGNLGAAAEQFEKLIESDPQNRSKHLRQLIDIYTSLNQAERAKKTVGRLLQQAANDPETNLLAAEVYQHLGESMEAIALLRRAVRANSRDATLRRTLAARLEEAHQVREAVDHYWRAFDLSEDLESKTSIASNLAELYAPQNQLDDCIRQIEQRQHLATDPVSFTWCLAYAYRSGNDMENAAKQLKLLLAKTPDDHSIIEELAVIAERSGDYLQAARYQESIVQRTPSRAQLERLASYYDRAGKPEAMDDHWDRLATTAPSREALLEIVDHALRRGSDQNAIALARAAWKATPTDWRFGYRIAFAYWRQDHHDEALRTLEEILALPESTSYDLPLTVPRSASADVIHSPFLSQLSNHPLRLRIGRPHAPDAKPFTAPATQLLARFGAQLMRLDVAHQQKTEKEYWEHLKQRAAQNLDDLKMLVYVLGEYRSSMLAFGFATATVDLEYSQLQIASELDPLLKEWIRRAPEELEPRLLRFLHLNDWVTIGLKNLDEWKSQFAWFEKHHPELIPQLKMTYTEGLKHLGETAEAERIFESIIEEADSVAALQSLGFPTQEESRRLAMTVDRLIAIHEKAPISLDSTNEKFLGHVIEHYAKRPANWEHLLTLLEIDMGGPIASGASTPGRTAAASGTQPTPTKQSFARQQRRRFPRATAYLDQTRMDHLQAVTNAFRAARKTEQLVDFLRKHAEDANGDARIRWALAEVSYLWWRVEYETALKALTELQASIPENWMIRLLTAHALQSVGRFNQALSLVEKVDFPLETDLKLVEQLRLELGEQTGKIDAIRLAATRLAGMNLSAQESLALAGITHRAGLRELADQFFDRLATGSNSGTLVEVLNRYASIDPERAAGIARRILQLTPRSNSLQTGAASHRHTALLVLRNAGKLDELIHQTEQLHQQNPHLTELQEDLLEYYTAAKLSEKIADLGKQLVANPPADSLTLYRMGIALCESHHFDLGLQLFGPVWKQQPELLLPKYRQIGAYYSRAKSIGRLTEDVRHISKALDRDRSLHLRQFALQFLSGNHDAEQVIGFYLAALTKISPDWQSATRRDLVQSLVKKGESSLAYQFLLSTLVGLESIQEEHWAAVQQTELTMLVHLANEHSKLAELQAKIAQPQESHWQPKRDLLVAMIERYRGDEGPLTQVAQRLVADKEFASGLSEQHSSLLLSLAACKTEAAHEAMVTLWKADIASDMHAADALAKLDRLDEARHAVQKAFEPNASPANPSEDMLQRRLWAGDRLLRLGFPFDAIIMYQLALENDLPSVIGPDTERAKAREIHTGLRASIRAINKNPDDAMDALVAALSGKGDLTPFFTVAEPSLPLLGRVVVSSTFLQAEDVRQLQPNLLQIARQNGKIGEIADLVRQARQQDPKDIRLQALEMMAAICHDPCAAEPLLRDWKKRIDQYELVTHADRMAAWLVTLTALDHPQTLGTGMEMAEAMITNSAQSASDGGRYAALMAIARALAQQGKKEQAHKLFVKLMPRLKPDTVFQVAEIFVHTRDVALAAATLDVLWATEPKQLLSNLPFVTDVYAKSSQVNRLAAGLRAVQSQDLRDRYARSLSDLFRRPALRQADPQHLADLLLAAIDFAVTDQQALMAISDATTYMLRLPQEERSLTILSHFVAGMAQRQPELSGIARQMLDVAAALNKLDEIQAQFEKVIENNKTWAPAGSVMLAMIARRKGDGQPFETLAERYMKDPLFAASLQVSPNLLRQELEACKTKTAMALALKLYINDANPSGYERLKIALLQAKSGDRDGARESLFHYLNEPMPPSVSSVAAASNFIQRCETVGGHLKEMGLTLDALAVYAATRSIGNSFSPAQYQTNRRLQECLKQIDELFDQHVANAEKTVAQLLAWLEDGKPNRLNAFLVAKEREALVPLFVPLLAHAKQAGQLDRVEKLVHELSQTNPSDLTAQSLRFLLAEHNGDPPTASSSLSAAILLAQQSPDISKASAAWIVADRALRHRDFRDDALTLIDTLTEKHKGNAQAASRRGVYSAMLELLPNQQWSQEARAKIDAILERTQGDDLLQLDVALACFAIGNHELAGRILKPLWEQRPVLLIERVEDVFHSYLHAGQGELLADHLRSVVDDALKEHHSKAVLFALNRLSRDEILPAEQIAAALRGAVDFVDAPTRGRAVLMHGGFVGVKIDSKQGTDIFCDFLLRSDGSAIASPEIATMLTTIQRTGRLDDLQRRCEQLKNGAPAFVATGDMILAMIARRQGNDRPFAELARRWRKEPSYASLLKPGLLLLRAELAQCDARAALELARDLYQMELSTRVDAVYDKYNIVPEEALARINFKFGDINMAVKYAESLLGLPMPNYGADATVLELLVRREKVMRLLIENGCYVNALSVYQHRENSAVSPQYHARLERKQAALSELYQHALAGLVRSGALLPTGPPVVPLSP